MQYRRLPNTEITVSTVAMGCWAIVGDFTWGPQEEADALAAIHRSLDAGVTFFDTAEGYGDGASERLLAKGLGRHRQEVVIATKVSANHLTPAALRLSCEQSLRALKTDYLDLYQVHWPSRDLPLRDTIVTLQALQREGKVRAIGVSNFGPHDLDDFAEHARPVTNQVNYSLLFRAIEYEVQPRCVADQIGILCYSPLAQGLLTGKFHSADDVPVTRARSRLFAPHRPHCRHQEPGAEAEVFAALAALRPVCARLKEPLGRVALAWLLQQPAVTAVLAGARNAAQAAENARAADLALPPDVCSQLADLTAAVKAKLGANPDMWQSESRMR